MSDVHHDTTTVVTDGGDRSGAATAIIAFLIVAFVAVMIWLFAFSGVVFDRHSGGNTVTNNNVRVQNPTTQTSNGTSGGGSSAPTPVSS